jgi:hypothetical protein
MFTNAGTRAGRGQLVQGGAFTAAPFAIVAAASSFILPVRRVKSLLPNVLCTISDGLNVVNTKVTSVNGSLVTMQVQNLVIGAIGAIVRAGAEIWVTGTTFAGSPGTSPYAGKYHPDRPPLGIFADEEYYSNAENLSWAWGTQGSAIATYAANGFLMSGDAANAIRTRFTALPTPGTDFVAAMKMSARSSGSAMRFGMAILCAGTTSAPTELWFGGIKDNGSNAYISSQGKFTSTTVIASEVTGNTVAGSVAFMAPTYLRLQYTAATKNVHYQLANDGFTWVDAAPAITAGAHPSQICILQFPTTGGFSRGFAQWFRVRTDQSVSDLNALIGS